jgi:hypothetical protein
MAARVEMAPPDTFLRTPGLVGRAEIRVPMVATAARAARAARGKAGSSWLAKMAPLEATVVLESTAAATVATVAMEVADWVPAARARLVARVVS